MKSAEWDIDRAVLGSRVTIFSIVSLAFLVARSVTNFPSAQPFLVRFVLLIVPNIADPFEQQ